jgi:hypothetical protein
MSLRLSLLSEDPIVEQFEAIWEEKNASSPASLYLKGPMMVAEKVNKNGRYYPIEEMRREAQRYITEMVDTGRAMGELNHPSSADVDLERACHLIVSLNEDNNVFYGKSKVLSTPCGQIVRCLINDGAKVGMSTRALGSLQEGTSYNTVKNMRLVAVDCVADPSIGQFVNGILESKQYVLRDDGKFEEIYVQFEESLKKLPNKERDVFIREQIVKFINAL